MITARYSTDYLNNKKRRDVSCHRFTLDEKNKNWTDESRDEQFRHDKDKFIELAQAALEEAKMEEEQKGVFQELLETFLARSGAPVVADVILEQFRSQDVIERLAEDHFEQQRRRSCLDNEAITHALKDPTSEAIPNDMVTNSNNNFDTIMLVSEYLWRIFRLLILACLVCLVYHFICTDPNQSLLKL
ncbi:uncharacterized protein B0P05DRAFT_525847 [Gilbertella persicaria]|uniref:uncharacterized protein n=1 Tax=Gilbertella persicaria TaxID=101096 RepID=UPI00221EDEBB|nr:uncharacterized protein B0P05DRAFT_525847 [Gilbertella persicaria]KAI8092337.1 hypothetical protein B0P05DRAFT_525847 [Gilbertella persicaria]